MGVVRRGHHDGVDLLLFVQHLAEVAIDLRLGVPLEDAGGVLVVYVAEGHDVVLAFDASDVGAALSADADSGDIEPLIGGRLGFFAEDAARNKGAGNGAGKTGQNVAAVDFRRMKGRLRHGVLSRRRGLEINEKDVPFLDFG